MRERIDLIDKLKIACISCVLFFMSATMEEIHAQIKGQLHASTDNVFVSPNQMATWNVLLNDAPGDCGYDELNMSIITPPTKTSTYGVTANNRIRYRAPNSVGAIKDSLQYQLSCGTLVSTAWVFINIRNKPDNVETDVCHVTPPPISFDIKELSRTPNIVNTVSNILCGDIDNDGEIEIIVHGNDGGSNGTALAVNSLLIFGVSKTSGLLYQKYKINLPVGANPLYPYGNVVTANVDDDGYAAIFVATGSSAASGAVNRTLIKYRFNGTTYTESWRASTPYSSIVSAPYAGGVTFSMAVPVIADFAADGNAQVQLYDKIYNAKTGVLLVDGKLSYANSTYGEKNSFGQYGHNSTNYNADGTAVVCYATSCVAGDIDGDGKPEIVAGDCVYKVEITNHAGTSGNSFKRIRRANNTAATGTSSRADIVNFFGATALADIDGDGRLDVVVAARRKDAGINDASLYVYNPRTGEMLNGNLVVGIPLSSSNNQGPSLPFIGDLDGDGKPEIALTGGNTLRAYKYNTATKQLTNYWTLPTADVSASTTLTLFDFTQSGKSQLVYRDEDSLRIIDGTTGKRLSVFFPVYSPTVNEYPIVADVNGDGSAEILAIGATQKQVSGTWVWSASLRMYGAAGTNKWAPARSVWHQNAYNPLYVNDDLTIPQYPLNPASVFKEADGAKINRPFNNFLQQSTNLNDEGDMLWLGPDLSFDHTRRTSIIYEPAPADRLKITIYITNDGDGEFHAPLRISTYAYDTSGDKCYIIANNLISENVGVGEFKTITYYINNYTSLSLPAKYDHWLIVLNAKDNTGTSMPDFPYNSEECQYWNNYTSNVSFSYGERVMCEGTTESITIIPENTYKFYWYKSTTEPDGDYFHVGDACTITKDNSLVQRYYVDVYSPDGSIKLTSVRDTINVYLAPDSLIWTGSGKNADWHNYTNWLNPNAPVPNPYPKANIPRRCTDVLVPDYIDIYPDLSDVSTIYSASAYMQSECANITFEHGGETARTDSLVYDSAYVWLNLDANRWYMLSAPLQGMFTGDYYVSDPNPHKDSVFVYTRLYAQPNPETGETNEDTWGWTGLFHNPNVLIPSGQGLSFWVDNKADIDSVTTHAFLFPKHDVYYDVFDWGGNFSYRANLSRANEHRFVYEPFYDRSFGDVELRTNALISNEQVLIGNPFMSHLDFKSFYTMNSGAIKNYYKILDKTAGNFVLYTIGGASTGTPALNEYIAPMQAFLIESRTSFSALYANADMMNKNRPGEKLRGSFDSENTVQQLTIEIFRGDETNRSLLIYSPDGNDLYGESISKTFLKHLNQSVNVYTLPSSGGAPLDLNYLTSLDGVTIPVGIRTSVPGPFRLNFAGLTDFAPDYAVYLTDLNTVIPVVYNLREGSVHEFEKTTTAVFDNRFLLSFVKLTTGTPVSQTSISSIVVTASNGMLIVGTRNGDPLHKVDIYDLQGRPVIAKNNIESARCEITLPLSGVYLIKASSSSDTYSGKIYVK